MDSVKSKVLCIGAAAVTLSGGDGAADGVGCGDEWVQRGTYVKKDWYWDWSSYGRSQGGRRGKEQKLPAVLEF